MQLSGCGSWLEGIDVGVLVNYKVVYDNQIYYVDRHNTEEVAYLFNVLLTNPNCKIYLCYSNGTEYKICLKLFKKNH